ncbi:MAG TPA: peptidylprolyl isomerase [Gemmatimonadaceae bacterium]|nr:peptidylprolyl isomerase [Gemmatimonadaceae bacterium]
MAPRGALGITLALLTACATLPGAAPRAVVPARESVLYARLLRMADARHMDAAVVHDALAARTPALRAAATRVVGQLHADSMAGALRQLLHDVDTTVAANAAFALGLLQDSASVVALDTALRAPASVAVEAAWALGRVGDPARPVITGALATRELRPAVASMLLLAAATLHPVPVASVRSYLHRPDAPLRWSAVYALARSYVPSGVELVLPLVDDSSGDVRAQVARELSARAAGDSLRHRAIVALRTLVHDPDPHVRIEAIRAMGSYGADAREPLLAATRDGDANVRLTAAQSLASVPNVTREDWMVAWRADTGLAYRSDLLAAAARGDILLPAAEAANAGSWAHARDWRRRAALASVYGNAGISDEPVRQALVALAGDTDPRVRAAALSALARGAGSSGDQGGVRSAGTMLAALHDDDAGVRSVAIAALARHATAHDAPLVLQSYRQAVGRDASDDAQIAAIHFLAAVWRRDSAAFPDSLRAAIGALPVSRDSRVRAAAGGASIFAAWKTAAPPPPPHPLAWYEQQVHDLILPALAGHRPIVDFATQHGTITVVLYPLAAPLTVENFLSLVRAGYYRNLRFHRVVPDFVVQDGDGRGDGDGGSVSAIRDELNRRRYSRGALGMALSGPDTGTSQYFLTLSPQPHLDGGYTVFGHVTAGYEVLDAIVQGDRLISIRLH